MRLAAVRDPLTFGKIRGTFERYWSGGDFEEFDAERFEDERHAAKRNGGGGDAAHVASNLLAIDLRPYPFQREILDQLHAEREVHGRDRALVVAATGTGKTVIAALDFARARREKADLSLLFIAHRKEILLKSRATFRHALRDTGFGELMVDGERPKSTRAVFASIQSLSAGAIEGLAPDAFDWVIVDEFHHAEAQSYRAILDRLRPRFLLGLTATPERADGRHVQETFFNGRITAEVRLWDALDRDLLAPFHYFAVADGTDLSGVRWTERGYTVGELGSVYMESRARVGVVLTALQRYVSDPSKMRAVGFCANVAHAEWMAEQFRDAGLAAKAIHGRTASAERDSAQRELEGGTLQALFVADLLNEGVDLPRIDTILFLRPTDSPVLFVQQLGRGLRLAEGKRCLTVLDFVGRHHKKFRVDRRFSAMTRARTRRQVEYELAADRFSVPPGCEIVLERQAREDVLRQLKSAIASDARALARELKELGPGTTLGEFLHECRLDLSDLYRGESTTWTALRRRAGFEMAAAGQREGALARALVRATYADDLVRLAALEAVGRGDLSALDGPTVDLVYALLAGRTNSGDARRWLESIASEEPETAREVAQLAGVLRRRLRRVPLGPTRADVPLAVHSTYSLFEISVALGFASPAKMKVPQAGVLHRPELGLDAFFVTVNKSERGYSPSTMYRDYALGSSRFHWESQNSTTPGSPTGRRYIEHERNGHGIWLFVRSHKTEGGQTAPYVFVGPARYVSHRGERPIAFEWELEHEIPAERVVEFSL